MEKSKNERNEGARDLCAILAHNVKELRKRKTLSQEKLSEITGLSVNEIGRIERNKTITGLGVLHALAKGLDISPERLLDPRLDPAAVLLSASSRRFPLEAMLEDLPEEERQVILQVAGYLAAHYRQQQRNPDKLYID